MQVAIEPFIGKSVADQSREVHFDQYRVRCDGMTIGYIGTQPGARLCMIAKRTPLEMHSIEKQVAILLEQGDVKSTLCPDVPAGMLKKTSEEMIVDDFDT